MDQAKIDSITRNFGSNVVRVRSLIEAYDKLGQAGGRPATIQGDVLRSAVVLMHASLEDVLRSASEGLLAGRGPEVLKDVGLPVGGQMMQKFSLGDLSGFRGRTVDDVIQSAVSASLQRSNYNSVSEVANTLRSLGINRNVLDPDGSLLESMMRRRHLIVHRADTDPSRQANRGVPRTQHLSKSTTETWATAVDSVGRRIIAALPRN